LFNHHFNTFPAVTFKRAKCFMQMKSFLYQTKLVSIAKSYSEFLKCFGLIF
jgi:hypothetical protein